MKLHLGCGQRYLAGYVNVDFPPASHTVQENNIADLHADILSLNYPPGTVEEVRLHHVFEHFPRPVACALLAAWYSWLKPGGKIHIEVPDLHKTARVMLSPFKSLKSQAVAERHIFGSHEASWAVHCEGYTPAMLKKFVESFGFKVIKIMKNNWRGIYNFELIAEKNEKKLTVEQFEAITEIFLKNFLVDYSESEIKLLKVWLDLYNKQVKAGWADDK